MEEKMALKGNISLDQGTDFSTSIDITDDNGDPINISTYTGAAQMRKHYTSSNAYSFTVTTSSSGQVTLSMNAAYTANITAGRYVYDCELTSDSNTVSRIIEGIVTVNPQVTR
jgi:hypothetical protein